MIIIIFKTTQIRHFSRLWVILMTQNFEDGAKWRELQSNFQFNNVGHVTQLKINYLPSPHLLLMHSFESLCALLFNLLVPGYSGTFWPSGMALFLFSFFFFYFLFFWLFFFSSYFLFDFYFTLILISIISFDFNSEGLKMWSWFAPSMFTCGPFESWWWTSSFSTFRYSNSIPELMLNWNWIESYCNPSLNSNSKTNSFFSSFFLPLSFKRVVYFHCLGSQNIT